MWSPVVETTTNRNWVIWVYAFVLLLSPLLAQAQDLCPPTGSTGIVGFNLNKTQACTNEQISISNASPSFANVTYYFNYDRKGVPAASSGQTLPTGTTATKTTYSAPGVYTILQTGSANGTGFTYCQTVEIVDTPPVSFTPSSCGNRTATLAIVLDSKTSKYDSFSISWGDGSSEVKTRAEVQAGNISHQYAGQLTYFPIVIQGLYANGGCPGQLSTQYVTVKNSNPPVVTALTANADGSISIIYQGNTDPVQLQQKDATGVYKPTGSMTTTGTFRITTDTKQVQCFKLIAISSCPNTPNQESEEVCSLVLSGTAISQENDLSWQAYAGTVSVFKTYQLSRDGVAIFSSPTRSVTTYADKNGIKCGTQYCYTLKATLQGLTTTTTITSAPFCLTGINASTVLTKPAVTALKTNSNGTITINYQSNDPVELQQKDANGVYQPVSITGAVGVFTVPANTSQVQCFKIVTKNPCGTPQESEEVCSMVLTATAVSRENDLSWQTYAGTAPTFTRYRIYRDGTPLVSINNKTTTTYADNGNIQCGQPYCYYIETTVRGQTETVITSAPICVTGINITPLATIQNLFVTIENGKVRVQAAAPTTTGVGAFTATISRADNSSGPFQPVGTVVNSLLFIDSTVNTNLQSYCYQITYQTSCGPPSAPSPTVCTVWLTSKTPSGIDWSADPPFSTGPVVDYTLETLDTQNNTTKFLDLGGNTHFDPDLNDPNVQNYRYRIVAYDANGIPSYSNYYEFRQSAKIYVPNAFTPNGDGANDTFQIKGVFVDQFDLTVFNRWGEAVFHATDPNMPWDGTLNGQPAPPGNYAYRLEIRDLTGERIVKSGPFLLIR